MSDDAGGCHTQSVRPEKGEVRDAEPLWRGGRLEEGSMIPSFTLIKTQRLTWREGVQRSL